MWSFCSWLDQSMSPDSRSTLLGILLPWIECEISWISRIWEARLPFAPQTPIPGEDPSFVHVWAHFHRFAPASARLLNRSFPGHKECLCCKSGSQGMLETSLNVPLILRWPSNSPRYLREGQLNCTSKRTGICNYSSHLHSYAVATIVWPLTSVTRLKPLLHRRLEAGYCSIGSFAHRM